MRKLAAVLALLFTLGVLARESRPGSVAEAYRDHKTHVEVSGSGTVVKLLRDDTKGARHQRFLLAVDGLPAGRTILVAHNTDIARRVTPLHQGNRIEFQGEYIWNPKGGILHWTHRDPAGHHPSGWLKRNGQTFD